MQGATGALPPAPADGPGVRGGVSDGSRPDCYAQSDTKPGDRLTVDGVIVAAYAPVYVKGRGGKSWLRA